MRLKMDQPQDTKWYYKPWAILGAILLLGPLAIPLIWKSPRINRILKIVISIAIVILAIWLTKASIDLYGIMLKEIVDIQRLYR